MPALTWVYAVRIFTVAAALGAGGCGSEEEPKPKLELTEEEKKQVEELNEQRMDEWGKRRK